MVVDHPANFFSQRLYFASLHIVQNTGFFPEIHFGINPPGCKHDVRIVVQTLGRSMN